MKALYLYTVSCACGDINHRDCGHYHFFIMWQQFESKSELPNLTNILRILEYFLRARKGGKCWIIYRDGYNSVAAYNVKYRMKAKNERNRRAHENHK